MKKFISALEQFEKDQQKSFIRIFEKIMEGHKTPDNDNKPLTYYARRAGDSALIFKTMKNVLIQDEFKNYLGLDYFFILNDIFDIINPRTKSKIEIIKAYGMITEYQINNILLRFDPALFLDENFSTMTSFYIINSLFEIENFKKHVENDSDQYKEMFKKISSLSYSIPYDKSDIKIINEFDITNFDEQDIEVFVMALANVGLHKHIRKEIREYLYILKEKNDKKNNIVIEEPIKLFKEQPKTKSKNDYLEEVKEVYDLKNNELLRSISNEEMYYYLNSLLYLSISNDDINLFLDKYYDSINEVALYLSKRDKFKWYAIDISYMDELLSLLISNDISDEEYIMWKDEFIKELRNIESAIPQNYNYEKEKVRKMKKAK